VEFDYCVINRDMALEDTVDTIIAIIQAEHSRVQQRKVSL
jgi:guanylate kinase